MVASCVAYKCNSLHYKNTNIQFHGLPFKRPDILTRWINAIKRADWTPTKSSKLCSVHTLNTEYGLVPVLKY
ncbi:THAP domain [Popillia japonica]|uniref:THAP domain n=1 Tax=Popillia japonica TaxID=7064 RepID=A0AAW1KJY0_POPJA